MPLLEFKDVDIVFGDNPEMALPYIDQQLSREQIAEKTGQILGVAQANLSVNPGEICVLMGLSGSGKSTLLRAINGLNKVARGSILLDHDNQKVDVTNCSASVLRHIRRHRVAMVFQQFALLPWLTVADNAAFGLSIRGINKKEQKRIVEEKLEMVGLLDWKDKYVHELSGGMQQRVGLARAFSTDADILLMDEPFSALDPLIRNKLQDDLLELQAQLKKTIVFVSHDLDEAIKLGNHIAIMEGGRIVQYAEPEQIVLDPASRYVAEFVGHMNPLNVLTGKSIMCTRDGFSVKDENNYFDLDWSGQHKVLLDADDKIIDVKIDEDKATLCTWHEDMDYGNIPSNAFVIAQGHILLSEIIKIRHATGRPAILINDQEQVIGFAGGDEIYQGMLNQHELIKKFDKPAA